MNHRSYQAWLNGIFIPQENLGVTVHDAGFVMGATVTDMLRTFRHTPACVDQHLKRFITNCEACRIPLKFGEATIATAIHDLVAKNTKQLERGEDLAVVLVATPGPIGFYLNDPSLVVGSKPNLAIHTFELPLNRFKPWIQDGVQLEIPKTRQPSPTVISPTIKHRSRMHWWIADQEAKAVNPNAQALLADDRGNITETASSNIILVENLKKPASSWVFHTPQNGSTLAGITQGLFKEFALEHGYQWRERDIQQNEIHAEYAGVLSCTSYCFAGVKSIGNIRLKPASPILDLVGVWWEKRFGMDWRKQILNIL